MILMEQSVGSAPAPSSSYRSITHEGITTVIILDRDGRISHQSPPRAAAPIQQASVQLPVEAATGAEASRMIDRIVDFAFDVLGVKTLEMRVYEQQR